ncbi:MAG: collagenase [Anaerolineae bacterium]|nr:collagenase [Anaerolineae bacterium]
MPRRNLLAILFLLLSFQSIPAAQFHAQGATPVATTDRQPDTTAINTLMANMQQAVLAQNRALYLAYVDRTDPVFWLEHSRWADDWSKKQVVTAFSLSVQKLAVTGRDATADLTMQWATTENRARTAQYPVRFRQGNDGVWRYAGEAWTTLETEHFRVRALPGLEGVAQELVGELPAVYDHVTSSLNFKPAAVNEIKLYPTAAALGANTLLSLPPISGWNEPGEALKLFTRPGSAPPKATLAHEFTHFISFEMAGTAHSRMPWWLEEGIAEYVGSQFWSDARQQARLNQVKKLAADNRLAAWDTISDFENTPVELWQYVYPQGYAFVRYVTETYGKQKRNNWLTAMAKDKRLPDATTSALGVSFDDLNAAFVAWLKG